MMAFWGERSSRFVTGERARGKGGGGIKMLVSRCAGEDSVRGWTVHATREWREAMLLRPSQRCQLLTDVNTAPVPPT